jgi:hypothetical protein
MIRRLIEICLGADRLRNRDRVNGRIEQGVKLPTAFPRGTIVHYNGIPCELLTDTPYYSETIEAARECEEAHLPGDCPRCRAT